MQYPAPSIEYLRVLTDCTGLIQHAVCGVPNRRLGYTTDDNARALIVAAQHFELTGEREALDLAIRYLSFVHHAQNADGKYRNVMSFERVFLDEEGTEDCFGRTIWALGCTASSRLPDSIRVVAGKLFDKSIVWAGDLDSPRSRAYSMLGIYEYIRTNEDRDDLRVMIGALADSLVAQLQEYGDKNWHWYEPYLTYGNAIIPLSMVLAAQITGRKAHQDAARGTLRFLTDMLIRNGRLEVIGNDGWCTREGKRAWFDQQSIDAGYTVYLYAKAHELLGDKEYGELAHIAYTWFFGNNRSEAWVYNLESKGCYDAINAEGVNLNQGAEACICFLLAQIAMQRFKFDAK